MRTNPRSALVGLLFSALFVISACGSGATHGGTVAADALLRRLVTERRTRTAGWNDATTSGTCTVAGRAVEAVLDSWRILSKAKTKAKASSSSRMSTTRSRDDGDDGQKDEGRRFIVLLFYCFIDIIVLLFYCFLFW